MSVFKWKSGFSCKVNPQKAGEELERLSAANGGSLKPEDIVEAARDESSPLHDAFTWDDSEAAAQWRKTEARRMVSGIRIIRVENNRPTLSIAYVSVADPNKGRGYQSVAEVMTDEELKARALSEAMQQMEGFQRRFGHLQELSSVFQAMKQIREAS